MKVDEIIELLDAKIVTGRICELKTVGFKHAFSSDLMSDVLRLTAENTVLITGLCNLQTIRTAEMAEIKLIIMTRGKKTDDFMRAVAEENDICIIETDYSIFRVSGELYKAGLLPIY